MVRSSHSTHDDPYTKDLGAERRLGRSSTGVHQRTVGQMEIGTACTDQYTKAVHLEIVSDLLVKRLLPLTNDSSREEESRR